MKRYDESYDVIVIGSGLGGTSTAAMLARHGYKTLVLERASFIGGRTLTYPLESEGLTKEKYLETQELYKVPVVYSEPSLDEIFEKDLFKGYTIDLAQHTAYGGPMSDIIQAMGGKLAAVGSHKTRIEDDEVGVETNNLALMIKKLDEMNLDLDELEGVSTLDFAKKYGWDLDGKDFEVIKSFGEALDAIVDPAQQSSANVIRGMRYMGRLNMYPPAEGVKNTGFRDVVFQTIGGINQFSVSFLNIVKEHGGDYRLDANVKEIVVENGKAVGVKLEDGEFIPAKIVVYSGTVQEFPNIMDKQYLSNGLYERMVNSTGMSAVLTYAAYDAPEELESLFSFFPAVEGFRKCYYNVQIADHKLGRTPEGKALMMAGFACSPEECREFVRNPELTERVMKAWIASLNETLPNYKETCDWKMFFAPDFLYSVKSELGETSKFRIDNQLPDVKNVFLAGDGVRGSETFGILAAFLSGETCYARIVAECPFTKIAQDQKF